MLLVLGLTRDERDRPDPSADGRCSRAWDDGGLPSAVGRPHGLSRDAPGCRCSSRAEQHDIVATWPRSSPLPLLVLHHPPSREPPSLGASMRERERRCKRCGWLSRTRFETRERLSCPFRATRRSSHIGATTRSQTAPSQTSQAPSLREEPSRGVAQALKRGHLSRKLRVYSAQLPPACVSSSWLSA